MEHDGTSGPAPEPAQATAEHQATASGTYAATAPPRFDAAALVQTYGPLTTLNTAGAALAVLGVFLPFFRTNGFLFSSGASVSLLGLGAVGFLTLLAALALGAAPFARKTVDRRLDVAGVVLAALFFGAALASNVLFSYVGGALSGVAGAGVGVTFLIVGFGAMTFAYGRRVLGLDGLWGWAPATPTP